MFSSVKLHEQASGASAERLDCLLDATSGRRGHFWMFVRDKEEHRAYIQLTRDYQKHPDVLGSRLPHRSAEDIRLVSRTVAVVLWRDLLKLVPQSTDSAHAVFAELVRRTTLDSLA